MVLVIILSLSRINKFIKNGFTIEKFGYHPNIEKPKEKKQPIIKKSNKYIINQDDKTITTDKKTDIYDE